LVQYSYTMFCHVARRSVSSRRRRTLWWLCRGGVVASRGGPQAAYLQKSRQVARYSPRIKYATVATERG